jgi:hypothetical protein
MASAQPLTLNDLVWGSRTQPNIPFSITSQQIISGSYNYGDTYSAFVALSLVPDSYSWYANSVSIPETEHFTAYGNYWSYLSLGPLSTNFSYYLTATKGTTTVTSYTGTIVVTNATTNPPAILIAEWPLHGNLNPTVGSYTLYSQQEDTTLFTNINSTYYIIDSWSNYVACSSFWNATNFTSKTVSVWGLSNQISVVYEEINDMQYVLFNSTNCLYATVPTLYTTIQSNGYYHFYVNTTNRDDLIQTTDPSQGAIDIGLIYYYIIDYANTSLYNDLRIYTNFMSLTEITNLYNAGPQ